MFEVVWDEKKMEVCGSIVSVCVVRTRVLDVALLSEIIYLVRLPPYLCCTFAPSIPPGHS